LSIAGADAMLAMDRNRRAIAAGDKVRKQPWHIQTADPREFCAIAGSAGSWKAPDGATNVNTCISTTAAPSAARSVASRGSLTVATRRDCEAP